MTMKRFFAPFTKVDEEKRQVWGVATAEKPDRIGEVMHYEWSKPHFLAHSELVKNASGGQSLFNIRGQHGDVAAGRAIAFEADDATKSFPIGVEVVDDNEWEKVKKGVYTGFSIGGGYGKAVRKGAVKLYEAKPNEISLVDIPMLEDAAFEFVKADGTKELRKFATIGDAPARAADDDEVLILRKGDGMAAYDISSALDILSCIRGLRAVESGEEEPEQIKCLDAALTNVKRFIELEAGELPQEDAPMGEVAKAIRALGERLQKSLSDQISALSAADAPLLKAIHGGDQQASLREALVSVESNLSKAIGEVGAKVGGNPGGEDLKAIRETVEKMAKAPARTIPLRSREGLAPDNETIPLAKSARAELLRSFAHGAPPGGREYMLQMARAIEES
jgi:hypothetical protein